MKSGKGMEACLNGSSCPEGDKRKRHTRRSFGLGSGDNDVLTDLDIGDHDTDDARK